MMRLHLYRTSNSTRSGRDIYRSLILTRHHGNILALVGTLDNCRRIYRRLNRGMRYTWCPAGPTTKSGCAGRVIGEGFHTAAPGQGCKIVLSIEILRFFCRQNRARRGTRRRSDQKDVDRAGLSYRRSASRQKPMPAPDGKLKMCSQVAPGYGIENRSLEAYFILTKQTGR